MFGVPLLLWHGGCSRKRKPWKAYSAIKKNEEMALEIPALGVMTVRSISSCSIFPLLRRKQNWNCGR